MSADLRRDTAVTKSNDTPGLYHADLPESWNYYTPSGGVLMTVALRAMAAELKDLRPLSSTTVFCSPVPDGPMVIQVEVLRRGLTATQARAVLTSARGSSQGQGPGLTVVATFVRRLDEGRGPNGTYVEPPSVPGPQSSRQAGPAPLPFRNNYEIRTALGRDSIERKTNEVSAPPRHARWYRHLVPQVLDDGTLDPLALPPLADTMPSALAIALGPSHPPFFAPSLDLTVHFVGTTRAPWILVQSTCRKSFSGIATADVELWDEGGTLLGYGTQTMLIRNIPTIETAKR